MTTAAQHTRSKVDAMSLVIGLIGCGRWGKRHLSTLKKFKTTGEVGRIVVCDVDTTRLMDIDVDAVFSSTETMLAEEELDAALIVTPPASHIELLRLVLNHQLPVLVEKPLGNSMNEVRSALASLPEGATVMVGFLLRHHEGVRRIHAMVKEGDLGDIHSFSYTRTTPRHRPEGAEPLTTLAVHGLDLMAWMLETPLMTMNVQQSKVETDKANLCFKTNQHQSGVVSVAWSSEKERRQIIVEGTLGRAELDFGTGGLNVRKGSTTHHLKVVSAPLEDEQRAFLEWVRNGEPRVYPSHEVLLDHETWLHGFAEANRSPSDGSLCEN